MVWPRSSGAAGGVPLLKWPSDVLTGNDEMKYHTPAADVRRKE